MHVPGNNAKPRYVGSEAQKSDCTRAIYIMASHRPC